MGYNPSWLNCVLRKLACASWSCSCFSKELAGTRTVGNPETFQLDPPLAGPVSIPPGPPLGHWFPSGIGSSSSVFHLQDVMFSTSKSTLKAPNDHHYLPLPPPRHPPPLPHHHHHSYVAFPWTSCVRLMQIRASIWGAFFFDLVFLLLTKIGERRLLHWGVLACWTQWILKPYNSPASFGTPTLALLASSL